MDETILTEIGLSANESKLYLALLEAGISTAGEIAKKSHVHRTNTYDSLQRLVEKGLVNYIERDQTKYYEAAPPKDILRYVKEKEEK